MSRFWYVGDDRMVTEATQYSLRHQGFIKMIKYENLTNNYIFNFLKLEAKTHRLYYYIDFIENKKFNLDI